MPLTNQDVAGTIEYHGHKQLVNICSIISFLAPLCGEDAIYYVTSLALTFGERKNCTVIHKEESSHHQNATIICFKWPSLQRTILKIREGYRTRLQTIEQKAVN
jgi:hypothetical protein